MTDRIIDSIDAYVYVIDPATYEILYVNKKLADMHAPRGLLGSVCWQAMHSGLGGPCGFCPRQKLESGARNGAASWELYDGGAGRHYKYGARAVEWSDGRRAHVCHFFDITEIKILTERSSNAKNDFMSRMSHEIRTPINAILGLSHIAGATDDSFKVKSCLLKIADSSKQLMSIINDVLDMSRIEAGELALAPADFRLEKMLMDVSGGVIDQINEKAQDFQVIIDRDVPQRIRADEPRLSQIIANLLTNASKFTHDRGSIKLHVSCGGNGEVSSDLRRVVFSVSDSGIGISPEDQQRLFAPFEQLDGSKTRRYGGTGLGLSLCKRLVELMGGEIGVSSSPGAGSTFSFYIDAELAGEGGGGAPVMNPAQKNASILYVDPSEDTRAYFLSLMSENKIPAKGAESGFAAIDAIEKAFRDGSPFTIIFIDWRMPLMNGIETARLIRDKFGDFADIVLVSNVEWTLIERAATEAGIARFISKPLFPSLIIDAINEIVGVPERSGARAGGAPAPDFSSKTILLAEDVQINRDIVRACLEPTGVALDFAENGLDALNKFRDAPDAYDLILMDLEMPEMNGCDATMHIRSLPHPKAKSIPILAMTAELFGRDIKRCLDAGMDGHLRKPISAEDVLEKLSEYLLPRGGDGVDNGGAAGAGGGGAGVGGNGGAGAVGAMGAGGNGGSRVDGGGAGGAVSAGRSAGGGGPDKGAGGATGAGGGGDSGNGDGGRDGAGRGGGTGCGAGADADGGDGGGAKGGAEERPGEPGADAGADADSGRHGGRGAGKQAGSAGGKAAKPGAGGDSGAGRGAGAFGGGAGETGRSAGAGRRAGHAPPPRGGPLGPIGPLGRFLPYIDAAAALSKLRNNKKLYASMLKNAKGTNLSDSFLDALQSGDAGAIASRADTLLGVAASLSLAEIERCARQLIQASKRRLLSQELISQYREAAASTFDIIDELASYLEEGR